MAWSGVSSACIGLGVIMHCHDIRVILFANNFGAKELGVLWLDLSQLDHLGYHLQALPSSDRAVANGCAVSAAAGSYASSLIQLDGLIKQLQ